MTYSLLGAFTVWYCHKRATVTVTTHRRRISQCRLLHSHRWWTLSRI